ncbi:MAG: hypothetical protein K9H49_01985 [Bacteroidales bacterium]|nr:hypothetical protein [Bacteroidales bacterium]MCF8403338.1 hypothetical protein [Bacteroidales bacterium]
MIKSLLVGNIFLVLILYNGFSQENKLNVSGFESFKNGGEVYFRFKTNLQNLSKINAIISIDRVGTDEWVYAYANKNQFDTFNKLNIKKELLQHPGTLIDPVLKKSVNTKEMDDWDFYPTYDAYIDIMQQFEIEYPNLCTVFSIGQSEEGRELMVARISDNASWDAGEAQFLYTSSMHGDETAGFILYMHLIDYLLSNYNSDPFVKNLVDNLDIWINPLANPDGLYAGGNNTIYGATRFNANFVDLNRNFPDPENGPHPDGKAWQAETVAFMELAENNRFVMSSNCHSGAEVFNYPWDTWEQLHADNDWWYYLGRQWADTVHIYGPVGYFNDLDNGVTNGYQWYTTNGNRQDYMNYFHHCREFILEISNIKILPENMLPDYWEYNYRSFLNYMQQALYGIRGTVTDSVTGQVVSASILIEGHDLDNSWVGSNPVDGWYFRPILQGTYNLSLFAPGYTPKTINNVEISNQQAVIRNIQLVYSGVGIEENFVSENFSVGPNPVKDNIYVKFFGKEEVTCKIEVVNMKGNLLYENILIFNESNSTYTINKEAFKDKFIIIKLSTGDSDSYWKIILNK